MRNEDIIKKLINDLAESRTRETLSHVGYTGCPYVITGRSAILIPPENCDRMSCYDCTEIWKLQSIKQERINILNELTNHFKENI